MRARLAWVLFALGSLLLTCGLVAGVANHEVMDGERFATHVDNIRKDPAVAKQLGLRLSERILDADPDLVAVKPLVESASISLVSSSAFGPIVQRAADELHAVFTETEPPILRLADIGAVLSAVLQQLDPDAAAHLPPGLDVTLSTIGSQSFAARSLHVTHVVNVLAWLLPLLAVLCMTGGLLLSANRREAAPRIGWAVVVSGGLLVVVGLVIAVWTSFLDTDNLSGALTVAVWDELLTPYWWTAGATLLAGGLLAGALETRAPLDPHRLWAATWTWATTADLSTGRRVTRALVFVALGALLVLRGSTALVFLAAVFGVGLAILGIQELTRIVREGFPAWRAEGRATLANPRWRSVGVTVAGGVVLVVLVGLLARPVDQDVPATVISSGDGPCNGHVELCDRTYDDVAFPATHNSMSAADNPRWFLPEQPKGLVGQLDDGIRVLLIDTWYGQETQRSGVIATSERQAAEALDQLTQDYGASVVQSALRLRDAASLTPTGPERPYLCHAFCELGSTSLRPELDDVDAWMNEHPRDVVTVFVQDEVSPADTAAAIEQAGLLPYVHTQQVGQPWPTLGEMISSGRRLVVLMENRGGGSEYPWLMQGFDLVQDTPFDAKKASQFSCELNRGDLTAPIFLVNHWLNNSQSRVSDAKRVNASDVLWPRVHECENERGQLPNYIAVDFYDQGDLLQVVDRLNGFE
jgi:hypothetical protein